MADLLLREGWSVRILDNIEPQTHRRGKPAWISRAAEFVEGDLRDRATMTNALDGIDVVFHQAAYGGYMPEIAKYVHVNSFGTAQMLEVISEKICRLANHRRIISAVYSEVPGFAQTTAGLPDGPSAGTTAHRDWQVHCPVCNAVT